MIAALALALALNGPAAQSCTAHDAHVAVPGAPHGLFVWNPYAVDGGKYESQLEAHVIGKDPTLCGVSLVVPWSQIEAKKGVFDFSAVDGPHGYAAPYVKAGLVVNLLFSDGPERGQKNAVTPAWLMASVPNVRCDGQPPAPDYLSPVFESAWSALIAAAVKHYSYGDSSIAPHVGYMRFAIGFGVEAIPAHFDSGAHKDCLAKWQATPVGFTYAKWVRHATDVVDAIGRQRTDKQLLVALNHLDGGPSIYAYPNAVAAASAPRGIGYGTENLGIANVATPTAKPAAPCDPHASISNLYWCQAFARHLGRVPYEFQTIVASTAPQPGVSQVDLGKALAYGMANHAQIFELYPQEWLAADVAGFVGPAKRAAHKAALTQASVVLGSHRASDSAPIH